MSKVSRLVTLVAQYRATIVGFIDSIYLLLNGLKVICLNKKTIKSMNMSQNNIITRYKTDLSKNINVVNTRNILKIMNIDDLCQYTKLIFVKNLKIKIIFVTKFSII